MLICIIFEFDEEGGSQKGYVFRVDFLAGCMLRHHEGVGTVFVEMYVIGNQDLVSCSSLDAKRIGIV